MKNFDVLKKYESMENCVKLYVPSTADVDKPVDNKEQTEKVMRKFAELFGGSTCTPATGAWIAENGKTVLEQTNIVYSYATERAIENNLSEVVALALEICHDMGQEAVSLEIDGVLHFIK